ncbi:MAG: SDR family oxidoreductase [Dehalococcoidales bacterium]|jgi:NAD(P)-dependent dehydrogenase (short-subunit alcohol dehydrogenase family)
MDLKGKVALITGGGSGLGTAIAQRFVKDGAKVCITGRRREKLEQAAKTMAKGAVLICQGDVSKDEDAKRMVAETVKWGGKLDILVNNAASDVKGRLADLAPDDWRKVIDINLTGPFLLMHEAIPEMIKNGGGSIINIASLGGTRCLPACPAYNTAKAGLIMLSQQAALDYGPYKIRVNAVCPGGIDTELLDEMILPLAKALKTDKQGGLDYFSHNVPLRRVSKPEEITGVCTFLASEESSFMTGAALLIDGGAAIVDVSGAAVTDAGIQ